MMRYNVSEINECIRTRRSIYPSQFSDRVVAKELIEVLLENARWAPTHKLTEPWRFTVFYNEAATRFGADHAEMCKTANASFSDLKANKMKEKAKRSSAIIAIVMNESGEVPETEEISAVAMAIENMYISCSAYGLGMYWGSGGMTYTQEMHTYLKLNEDERCLGFIYLGYPDGDWPKKTARTERRIFTKWIEE